MKSVVNSANASCFLGVLYLMCLCSAGIDISKLPEVNGDKFYYFGYGSNMLAKRIHSKNPTAQRIGAGVLKDYRLDFRGYASRWDGAPATIVYEKGSQVLGTLWKIDLENMRSLDEQEGVHLGVYTPISVGVYGSDPDVIMARTYYIAHSPTLEVGSLTHNDLPEDRQPSKTYMQCLVKGAMETGLNRSYVNWLKSIKHNGRVATEMEKALDLETIVLDN